MATATRITRRIANVRRHTVGFIVNGRRVTRSEAVRMARSGTLRNVRVVGSGSSAYIQGTNGMSLLNLPVTIEA